MLKDKKRKGNTKRQPERGKGKASIRQAVSQIVDGMDGVHLIL